jgi:hypothetical protein
VEEFSLHWLNTLFSNVGDLNISLNLEWLSSTATRGVVEAGGVTALSLILLLDLEARLGLGDNFLAADFRAFSMCSAREIGVVRRGDGELLDLAALEAVSSIRCLIDEFSILAASDMRCLSGEVLNLLALDPVSDD